MRILIVCTGNSCRSQMAAGFLASMDARLDVHSAGTYPASYVHPRAIEVMKEAGVDISQGFPKSIDAYRKMDFDYVITVCDSAKETCPVFSGNVGRRIHMGFEDPSFFPGTDDEKMTEFRRVRDEIHTRLEWFYRTEILPQLEEG
jgi:arsenate reductase